MDRSSTRPAHSKIKHLTRFQNDLSKRYVLKVSYKFPYPNNVKAKAIEHQLDMLYISLWRIKHFQGFKKTDPRGIFWKYHICYLDNIKT